MVYCMSHAEKRFYAVDRLIDSQRLRTPTRARARVIDRQLLALLQRPLEPAAVRLELWDGTSVYRSDRMPVASVEINDRPMLVGLVRHPELEFGEGYSSGRLNVGGDFLKLLEAIYRTYPPKPASPWSRLSTWRTNTLDRSRHDIHHHYDLGNDFYRLWLDEEMLYTCAYYPDDRMTLEQAQIAKMRHVCRKLALQPGERVVEAGCGWGSLALYMARHYGVSVTAYNISHEQIRYARSRAQQQGLSDRVQFIEDDYRTINDRFDVFVSVGMLEHVGLKQYPAISRVIHRALDPERGRGLLHFISRDYVYPLNAWIRKRIFPGAYPPTLAQVMTEILEPPALTVTDVENLRPHYAKTLEHWRVRFEDNASRIKSMFDDGFVRAWRLYLAGSHAAFTTGWMQLLQVVFARSGAPELARIRD